MGSAWLTYPTVLLFCYLGAGHAHGTDFKCGVVTEAFDWNKQDQHGDLSRFETEICRAIATANHGNQAAIRPFNTEPDAIAALRAGAVALVVGVTPDTANDAQGVHFGPTLLQDAQAIMAAPDSRIAKLADLAGRTLCSIDGTDSELIASAALAARHIRAIEFPFQEQGEMESGLLSHHCQAVAGTLSRLAQTRAAYAALAHAEILPERLALVPLAAATMDARLGTIINWSINALLQAEQLGITQANAATWQDDGNIEAERLMGADTTAARALDLPPDWARRVIEAAGNYGEIYQRTIGAPLHLPRGMNALWNAGGVMAAPPLR